VEWLSDVLGIFGSAAGGGLIGAIAAAFNKWQERKDREAERKHQVEMRKLDHAEMEKERSFQLSKTDKEIEGAQRRAETEAQAATEVADRNTQVASLNADKATYSMTDWVGRGLRGTAAAFASLLMVFVDFSRGMIRPAATVYLLVVQSVIAWALYQIMKTLGGASGLTGDQVYNLLYATVQSLNFLSATALTWWFGARPSQQR